jgi:hypothetical protein
MDLHGIAAGAIGAVNPFVTAQLIASTGSTTNPDGSVTPGYAAPVSISVQAQELSFKELQHANNLNLQGILKSIYCHGTVQAVNRVAGTGGDKIVIAGVTYLVVAISEQWPDWVKVIGQEQVNP